MSAIWKTPLNLEGDVTTTIEHGGRQVLHVGLDATGPPCVWYWSPVDFVGDVVRTTDVVLLGTGVPAAPRLALPRARHVGTFVYGMLVLHAFEKAVSP